jgi:hypothetical protein
MSLSHDLPCDKIGRGYRCRELKGSDDGFGLSIALMNHIDDLVQKLRHSHDPEERIRHRDSIQCFSFGVSFSCGVLMTLIRNRSMRKVTMIQAVSIVIRADVLIVSPSQNIPITFARSARTPKEIIAMRILNSIETPVFTSSWGLGGLCLVIVVLPWKMVSARDDPQSHY